MWRLCDAEVEKDRLLIGITVIIIIMIKKSFLAQCTFYVGNVTTELALT